MVSSWGPHGEWVPHGDPMGTPWGSHEVYMGSPWGSHGVPMGCPWGTHGDTWGSHGVPMGSHGVPIGTPWGSHGNPLGYPWSSKKVQSRNPMFFLLILVSHDCCAGSVEVWVRNVTLDDTHPMENIWGERKKVNESIRMIPSGYPPTL